MIQHEIDTGGQIEAVERTVRTRDGETTIHTTVSLSQVYPTDAADLWEACSQADRLARWFAPVTGDLELGGRFQVQGNAGGTIKECDPPHGFLATWEFGGETSDLAVRISPEGDGHARLTIEHSADGDPERWAQFGPGAVGVGWDLALLGLSLHVTTAVDKPAEATEWGESDEAKRFMADASRRWGDAAVAAGTPEEDARAAEGRTTAFYTGAGPGA